MPRSRTSSRDNIQKPTSSGQNQDHADSRSRPNREQKTPDPVRLVASLQQITQIEKVTQGATSSLGELRSGVQCEGGGVCAPDPTLDSFKVYRNRRGKLVQNVWVDTHDLLNEAGGFTFNLRHGPLSTRELKLHLCIRQKKPCVSRVMSQAGGEGLVATATQPGTLTVTDDYAREIFRAIQGNHELQTVSARLEINDKEDPYDFKPYKSTPPTKDFLTRFIQVCPTMLTKFIVEMPGLSAVYLPEWKFLMEQQICIRVIICNFGVVMWHFYERTIIQNSTTLERIILRRLQSFDSVRGIYIPMKWQIFMGCKKLVHLKVTCGFKNSSSALDPAPPNHVFLHERLDTLPRHPSFAEFHVAKIWIDSCALQDLTKFRPNLEVCLNCYDMEYSDADLPPELCPNARGDVNELRMVTISRLDLQAEFPPHLAIESGSTNDERQKKRRRRPRDERNQKRLTKIIIFLFVIILLALAVLFIIIFFKHWRKVEDPETVAITSGPDEDELRYNSNNERNATSADNENDIEGEEDNDP